MSSLSAPAGAVGGWQLRALATRASWWRLCPAKFESMSSLNTAMSCQGSSSTSFASVPRRGAASTRVSSEAGSSSAAEGYHDHELGVHLDRRRLGSREALDQRSPAAGMSVFSDRNMRSLPAASMKTHSISDARASSADSTKPRCHPLSMWKYRRENLRWVPFRLAGRRSVRA